MNVKRYGMAIRLRPEKKDYYINNHQNVWPEVLSELKKNKVYNYSIFIKENFLFGYLEYGGNNFEEDMEKMEKIPIINKWEKSMIECFKPFPNNEKNKSWVLMDEIFHMK